MSFPGMGGDSVMIEIGGNSVPLVDALAAAQGALKITADQMKVVGSTASEMGAEGATGAKAYTDALKVAADQMDMTTRSMKVLSDMSEAMGATAADSASAWLQASTGAAEYGAKLDYLTAQIRMVSAANEQMAATMGGGASMGFMESSGILPLFSSFADVIGGLGGKIMPFLSSMTAMVAGFAALGVIEDAIGEVKDFTDSLVELNIQTEKNQFSWRYLYGGGNTPQGAAVAQGIADWTKSFSINIPYTRQDLLNAVSNLAPMGLSAQGLEHYMPMIADLAATRDPNADLSQVAQVIMSASMGYTRMLKYDLKINPEDLLQYGLNATGSGVGLHINDPSTLLPALENYTKAKGLSGAANDIAHDTFWGAWSSFLDRIQNFELDTGKGLFGSLKNALNDLSSWIDQHHDQINQFAALLSDTLGGAFKTVATDVGDFIEGVGQSGLFDFLFPNQNQPAKKSAPPGPHSPVINKKANYRTNVLAGADEQASQAAAMPGQAPSPTPWQQLGKAIGDVLTMLGQAKDFVSQMAQNADALAGGPLKSVGDNLAIIGNSITPEDREVIKDVLGLILAFVLGPTFGILEGLAGALQLIVWWMTTASPKILEFTKNIQDGLGNAVKWVTDRFGDLIGKIKDLLQWLHILPANYGGLGVSSTPKGSERAAANVKQASLNLNGGYGSGQGVNQYNQVVIYGSSTMEVQAVIDGVLARRDVNTNSVTRSPGRLPVFSAFPSVNGGPF